MKETRGQLEMNTDPCKPAGYQIKLFGAVVQTDFTEDFLTCPAAMQARKSELFSNLSTSL